MEANNQVTSSPSAGKNIRGIVLAPCHTWKSVPTAIFGGVDISEAPKCHLLQQRVLSKDNKNDFRDWCPTSISDLFLTH